MKTTSFGSGRCKAVARLLYWHPGDVPPAGTSGAVLGHLQQCARCATSYQERERLRQALRGAVRRTRVPERLADDIGTRLRGNRSAFACVARWLGFGLIH